MPSRQRKAANQARLRREGGTLVEKDLDQEARSAIRRQRPRGRLLDERLDFAWTGRNPGSQGRECAA